MCSNMFPLLPHAVGPRKHKPTARPLNNPPVANFGDIYAQKLTRAFALWSDIGSMCHIVALRALVDAVGNSNEKT